jgi:hypothetical protein
MEAIYIFILILLFSFGEDHIDDNVSITDADVDKAMEHIF